MKGVIYLLPGNKLFAASPESVMIIDYLSITETNSLPPPNFTDVTAMPLWEETSLGITLGFRDASVSKPFFCSHSIRFTCFGRANFKRVIKDLHGVIISYPYNEGPTEELVHVSKLMKKIDMAGCSAHLGYNRTFVTGPTSTDTFNYSWPDEQNQDQSRIWLRREGTREARVFLDEESGRVIIPSNTYNYSNPITRYTHDIWDFSLLYLKNTFRTTLS